MVRRGIDVFDYLGSGRMSPVLTPYSVSESIDNQYYHAKLHGKSGKLWKVGSHALDEFGYRENKESWILGIRVEWDCSLGRDEVKLIW